MSEKILLTIGVIIFSVTVLGVLWYFYLLLAGISPISPIPGVTEDSSDTGESGA
ncbi:MAG: hypothetical protein WCJ04_05010 [Actinomycetes bacterium]